MFSIWSSLNSAQTQEGFIKDKLKNLKQTFLSPLSSYYKREGDKKENSKLKKNENDLVKKLSNILNLNEESCGENYLLYLNSTFNHFIISSDLLEKLQVDELFSAHFLQFVNFYYRERYSFLKTVKFIITSVVENSHHTYSEYILPHLRVIPQLFSRNDLNQIYQSSLKDYALISSEIKNFSTRKNLDFPNADIFQEKYLTQLLKELEIILETIFVLTNLIKLDYTKLQELLKEFNSNSIIKYLMSSPIQSLSQFTVYVDQITNLHSFIIIKALRLDKLTRLTIGEEVQVSYEEKAKMLNQDFKNQMNDFIQSFASNQKASPIILTWSTLLYNLSNDSEVEKIFTNELKSLTSRMFSLSLKENVFNYLLDLLASDIYKNQDLVWYLKQTIYEMLNSALFSFDDSSFGDNLKIFYELTFFCMHKNEVVCKHFWELFKLPDRENLTILIYYALETFPISLSLSLTFFSLISKTSPELCKQTFQYLSRMDQFCEYLENVNPDEYAPRGDQVQLLRNRRPIDSILIPAGTKGAVLSHLNSNTNVAHRMILQNQSVTWNSNFSCLELIQTYLNKINLAASQNNLVTDSNIIAIIQIIDSLFKYFFDIDDLTDNYLYEIYTKYMEGYVNSCFTLFTYLMNFESPDSYRLVSKILEFFTNVSPYIYDKLIRVVQQNNLIGHNSSFDKMSLEELFNNRVNLIKSSNKILFLFKSQDYELIINYFKFIERLIKESGNNLEYLSPLCAMLVYVFPEIYKWNNSTINLNIELSITCLNLFHTVLNRNLSPSFANTDFMRSFSLLHSESVVSTDQLCESVLLNTECSESILNLIYTAYECSQDSNFLNEIKRLENILIQSISLVNRLLEIPEKSKTEQEKFKEASISQSILYFSLVKSISQQNQVNSTATTFQSSLLNGSSSSSNEVINKNNQFLLQLNLLVSQANPYLSKNLTVLNSATITDNKNEINWFHLLTKIAIYKSNHSINCLLFSIFKKISQLTPRLFGSLLGPYTQQMHSLILNKLKKEDNGLIISTLSEFICSLIENQPGFLQTLADLKIETVNDTEKFIEGDQSIFKELFVLLERLEKNCGKTSEDYWVSLAGILSIFNAIWSNKKLNYMNYCKQKPQFWPLLSSTLSVIKKDLNAKVQVKQDFDENGDENILNEYIEFYGDEYFSLNDDFTAFDQFILDAIIKSVSNAFKIFSYEMFELIFKKNVDMNSSDLAKIFQENVINKNLIEKWLDFYVFQLKRDLFVEYHNLINQLELSALNEDDQIKQNASIIDPYSLKSAQNRSGYDEKKKLKSKSLLDSIKMILLLINKATRIAQTPSGGKQSDNPKVVYFLDKLSMKKIKLDHVLKSLLGSLQEIIKHFLELNNSLARVHQEQKIYQQKLRACKLNDFFLSSQNKKITLSSLTNSVQTSNFITLKQSNEIVKEFHSISNTLMILVTSVTDLDRFEDSRKLKTNLIELVEKLILDEFNYFPAIINSVQASLLHLVRLNKPETISFMEPNESLLKRVVQICCKIFSKSMANLEDEEFLKSNLIKDCVLTFVLNNELIKFLIVNFDQNYWYNEFVECCMIQCMYVLFEKYIHRQECGDIVYSIMDVFFSFANNQAEHLAKSDFNTRTCLLASKLFEFSTFLQRPPPSPKHQKLDKDSTKWSSVLKIYINIQTLLLEKLKYKYLKDSILFFGSYFETMAHLITSLDHSLDADLLDIIRAFSRYLSQMSNYTKELLLNIQNSNESLQRLFTTTIQLCIMKLSHVKIVSMKSALQTSIGSQTPLARFGAEDLVNIQNLLFSIISLNLTGLFNFAPNFADSNYSIKLDEYKFLLTFQLAPPSTFDSHSPLSFGSILWLIDYILRILHKYDQNSSIGNTSVLNATTTFKNTTILSSNLTPNKRLHGVINSGTPSSGAVDTSPKKNVSILVDEGDTKLPSKTLIVCVLEKSLNFLLSQIVLCERQPQIPQREKKMLKRELNSEINSIIQGLGRSLKKQSTSTSQYPTKSPTTSVTSSNAASSSQIVSNLISTGSKQTYEFFKSIQFVLQQNAN